MSTEDWNFHPKPQTSEEEREAWDWVQSPVANDLINKSTITILKWSVQKTTRLVNTSRRWDSIVPRDGMETLCPFPFHLSYASLGQNTAVGCHSLLQGILPTQGSNPGLLHCRWILHHLSHHMTQRDGMGREEGGGFRMGNTCIPVADSFWYMAKPIQYCKVKKKKKKKSFSESHLAVRLFWA